MLNSGITKFRTMTQENLSSRSEDAKTKELEKKLDRLEKVLELQRRTIEHDRKHHFGKYEMT